jgi:hypothetical protein
MRSKAFARLLNAMRLLNADDQKRRCQISALRANGYRQMDIGNESNQVDRAISTGKLNTLLRLHTRPINVVVYHGSV